MGVLLGLLVSMCLSEWARQRSVGCPILGFGGCWSRVNVGWCSKAIFGAKIVGDD